MKNLLYTLLIAAGIVACSSTKQATTGSATDGISQTSQDTIVIENPDLEYQITIIENGFNYWLASQARQRGYYSQTFLENKNRFWVTEYNNRVRRPFQFDQSLYQNIIDYENDIDYGYEVNFMLYNYLVFFQEKYEQNL